MSTALRTIRVTETIACQCCQLKSIVLHKRHNVQPREKASTLASVGVALLQQRSCTGRRRIIEACCDPKGVISHPRGFLTRRPVPRPPTLQSHVQRHMLTPSSWPSANTEEITAGAWRNKQAHARWYAQKKCVRVCVGGGTALTLAAGFFAAAFLAFGAAFALGAFACARGRTGGTPFSSGRCKLGGVREARKRGVVPLPRYLVVPSWRRLASWPMRASPRLGSSRRSRPVWAPARVPSSQTLPAGE